MGFYDYIGSPNLRRGSIFASGFGPGGPNPLANLDRGFQIWGSESARTPALTTNNPEGYFLYIQ